MKKLIIALFVAAATTAISAPLAIAGNSNNGNSYNAQACQKGGWQNLAHSEDPTSGFSNQDECVSYGAHGGKLVGLVPKAPVITTVAGPSFGLDTSTCSVTVPYTQGIDTILYGVNGVQQTPITQDVTVTGGLDGADKTAPQFWIGYTAQPGYAISNPGASPTHFDFYNGDNVRDC
jgi:hypothetical protein